jgi:hypothetical protein
MGSMFTVAAALMIAGSPAALNSQSIGVHGEGHTMLNFSTGAFEGAAMFHLDGVPYAVAASTVVLEQTPLPNGTIRTRTAHTYDFGGGNVLITSDHGRLVPTQTPGIYELHAQMTIASGTGMFEGATGHLRGLQGGTISFITFEAHWTTMGVVTLRP